MIGMLQKSEISISGGGTPWELIVLIAVLMVLVVGLIVWLYRSVRKNIEAEDQWNYEQYLLMKEETLQAVQPQPAGGAAPAIGRETMEPAAAMLVEAPSPPRAPEPAPMPSPSATKAIVAREEHPASQERAGLQPPVSMPSPSVGESVFQTFEHEIEQKQRSHIVQLAVGGLIVLSVAVYFLVFPVQDAVNSAVVNIGHRLDQLFKAQPKAQDQLATLPQLNIAQEATPRGSEVEIAWRVRNISSETLSHLFAEVSLTPVGVELTETRLIPIEPDTLSPNQEGKSLLRLKADEFSKYQLTRVLTADRKEIPFKLWLALPSNPSRQP